jgi:hypothetical protein
MRSTLNLLAAIGLAPSAVFDLAGTLVSQPDQRSISCGIDSLGLIMAPTLLALKFFRSVRTKEFAQLGDVATSH